MPQGTAKEGERTFEKVGADEGAVGAEAMENDGRFAGANAWWIKFTHAGSSTTGEGADGGGPVESFGGITGAEGAESSGLARSVAGLESFAVPGVVKLAAGEEFPGEEGVGEDKDF